MLKRIPKPIALVAVLCMSYIVFGPLVFAINDTSNATGTTNVETGIEQRGTSGVIADGDNQEETNIKNIVGIISFVILIIIVGIGVFKTFDGSVMFFESYTDLFFSFIPFILFVSGVFIFKERDVWFYVFEGATAFGAIGYNFFKAFQHNRDSKFLAFCVGIGRITLGYLIPILIVGMYAFEHATKREGESDNSFQIRRTAKRLEALAVIGVLAVLLRALVRGSTVAKERKRPRIDALYDNEIYSSNESGLKQKKQTKEIKDTLFIEAVKLVLESRKASIAILQKRLGVGYTRATRLLDIMEEEGVIGPSLGSRSREILVDEQNVEDKLEEIARTQMKVEIEESKGIQNEGIDIDNEEDIKSGGRLSLDQVRKNLAVPDMRPGLFDGTLEAWLIRIGTWGTLKLEYYDPETRKKSKISKTMFMQQLSKSELLKVFGEWNIEELAVNKIVIHRDYIGLDGRKYKEKFFVTIDLKKELKQTLRKR